MAKMKEERFNIVIYIFFVIICIVMIYPLWYVVMYSFSVPGRTSLNNYYLIPDGFSLEPYKLAFTYPAMWLGMRNSSFVTLAGTSFCVLMTVITAFPLSRHELVGRKFFSGLMIFTMLFGGGLIPTYLVVRSVGLVDSLWALIIPSAINTYYVLVMVKFFNGIPISLIESAKIDGYNEISILFKIVLPLSKASLASIALFYAVGKWNEYTNCIIYIVNANKRVLQVIVRGILVEDMQAELTGVTSTPQSMRMAAIMVSLLPILCVYPFLQKHFMKGVMIGSVKG